MNKINEYIKKHKILTTIISIILIIIIILIITFNIIINKNPDILNYKTITYKRNKICDLYETTSDSALNYNLYEILETTEYSNKIFILNNFNVEELLLKSYKNKPAKVGDATITINECDNNKTRKINGRYKIINDKLIIIVEQEIFIYHYDKKENTLVDFNSYTKENNNIKYSLNK